MKPKEKPELVYILAGTTREYTAARQKLNLIPPQATWVTRASNLNDLKKPKVYRYGSWKELERIDQIEDKLREVEADIEDID